MRTLVTGSHGFIGKNLVAALKARGDEVITCDVKPGADIEHLGHLPWHYSGYELDEIYHLACVNQEEAVDFPVRNLEVNAGLARIAARMAAGRGARFVYTSTASVYGHADVFPTPHWRPPAPRSDYAVAKLAGEWFVRNSGADYTIFRLSNVYGPHQTTGNPYCGVIGKFLESARAGKPLQIIGDGSQTRDFTYVDDVVDALLNPYHKSLLNVSHGKETSILDLSWQITDLIPFPEPEMDAIFVPERPIDGIQRRWLKSDVECPTDLSTGLQKTLSWLNGLGSDTSDCLAGIGSD